MQYFECLVGLTFCTHIGAPYAIKKGNWNNAGNIKPQSLHMNMIRANSSIILNHIQGHLKHLRPISISFQVRCLSNSQLIRPQVSLSLRILLYPPIVPPMPATPAVHLTSFPLPAGPGPRRPQKSRGRRSSPERTWRGTVAQISNVWWFLRPMVELISSVPPQKDLEKV